MGKLKALKPRLSAINTNRIRTFVNADVRITGTRRFNLKHTIHARDGGRCCMCKRAVSYEGSNLDHRVALQFGGTNDESNLWTLCIQCHDGKSARERKYNEPDAEALQHDVPDGSRATATRFNLA